MSVCACGRITNDGRPLCDRCTALASFGLTRQSTQSEIKEAYRVLAKVWHPDRFQADEQLRVKAEEKLKEINSAYQLLTTPVADTPRSRTSGPDPRAEDTQPASTAASARVPPQNPRTSPFNSASRTERRANSNWLFVALAILVACGVSIYWWLGKKPSPIDGAKIDGTHPQTSKEDATTVGSIGQIKKGNPATNDSGAKPSTTEAHARTNAATTDRASVVVYPSDDPLVPYFTVGSTKADVMRVQGTPDRTSRNTFDYGASEVYFSNGRVESWHEDPNSPLKARLPQ